MKIKLRWQYLVIGVATVIKHGKERRKGKRDREKRRKLGSKEEKERKKKLATAMLASVQEAQGLVSWRCLQASLLRIPQVHSSTPYIRSPQMHPVCTKDCDENISGCVICKSPKLQTTIVSFNSKMINKSWCIHMTEDYLQSKRMKGRCAQ